MVEVSVVIPTRNRPDSVMNLLADLSKQFHPLKEVILVDSSDVRMDPEGLSQSFPALNIRYYHSRPSVCIQRNLGTAMSTAPYVFLCDDDIHLPENYVSVLMQHVETSGSGAVSGLVMQKEGEEWCYQYPPTSFGRLLFAFIFQHSVWGNVEGIPVAFWQRPLYAVLKKYYYFRKNTISLAGWPVLVDFQSTIFRAAIYGLGASIIKREWLIHSPYDEVLDAHGIGDNYGVAMGFPAKKAIEVVSHAKAYHHQSMDNRLEGATTYYRRLLALYYFLKKYPRFTVLNRAWFIWSLIGNLILFRNKKEHRKATKSALFMVLKGKNPYWRAWKEGEKVVEVDL